VKNHQKTKIGDFLFERKGKYKPDDERISGLNRISKIDFSGKFHIAQKPSKTNMILIKSGDLVVSGINVSKGAMGIYYGEEDVVATIHYSSYTFDSEKINVEYFKRFLKSAKFINLLKEQVKGGIKTEIKPKHILPLEIDLPIFEDQGKIVSHLKSIENEDDELKQEIINQQSLLKKFHQQILQEAIEGKLTDDWRKENPDVEPASELLKRIKAEKEQLIKEKKIKKGKKQKSNDLGAIHFILPKKWFYSDLDDVTQFTTDGTHQTPTYVENGRIFLSAQNVKPFKFMPENHKYVSETSFNEYTKGKKAEIGDLLVGRVGSKGETAVIDQNIDFAFYVSLGFVKTFKEFTVPEFICLVMNSPYGNTYATGNMSSTGVSAGNYNLGRIRSFRIPFPPLLEQKAIVEKVEKLFAICDNLENEIDENKIHSEQLMQAVLREAFSQSESV